MRKLYAAVTYCRMLAFTATLCLLAVFSSAQTNIANYGFSVGSGTYTPLSGATVLWTSWDSETSAALPLGGTFTYGGASFTTCYVSANGAITFGAASSSSTILSTLGSTTGAVAAWVNDGANSTATGATPSISYMNVGGATGEFVVQFADHARYSNRSVERLNFQIRLNLATNEIKIVYGSFTPSGTTATSSQVGIRGNSTTYATNVNNLMLANIPAGTTCNWSNPVTGVSNASTMLYTAANTNMNIPSGLTYTWAPQTGVAPVRTFAAVSSITSSGATITWTAPTGATQYNVQYRIPGSCSWTNFSGNPVSGNTATLTGLIPATSYQVRVQASNGTINSIWSHIPNTAGTGDGYTTTGTFTTAGIPTDLQAQQLQTPVVNNSGCYLNNETVTIRIRNAGTGVIDFATNNATISASVTGPNATTFTPVVISTGTLAAGATQDVVVGTGYNMSAAGTYTFNATAVLATPDANNTNDAIAATSRTSTAAATLPQLVGFAGYTGTPASLNTAFPGWTEGSGAVTPVIGGDGSFLATSSTAQVGLYGAAAKMNLYNTNAGWIISPKFVPTAAHEFKYKAALVNYNTVTATDFGPNDTVKAMISTDCGVTWITLREFNASNPQGLDNSTNSLRFFNESLSAYAGQQVMVAIYARRTPTGTSPDIDIVIDDLAIDVPTVCFEPTGFSYGAFTPTSVELNWNAPTSGGAAVDYQIYYSTSSTTPAAGATPNITGAVAPASITALTANTLYYVWVRTNCGSGQLSHWAAAGSFRTLCTAVSSFSENFDGVTAPNFPDCWKKVSTTGGAYTQTASNNSAPNTLYIYAGSATDNPVVSMPPVDNLAAGTHRLRFKARANFTAGADIEVGYLTNPADASTFTAIQTITTGSLTYQDFEVIPGAIAGADVLAFRHTGNFAYSSLIDDVKWEAIPTCDAPTAVQVSNITATDAELNWTPPATGSPVDYQIYVSTSNTAPTASATPTTTGATAPATLTGLTANTPYFVWVRANCGGTDISAWSSVLTFTTACNATNVPYTQDFESATAPNLPMCTSRELAGGANNWYISNNPGYGFTTNVLRYDYNSSTAANAWFFTQGLNLTAGTSYRLTFRYGSNSTAYNEKLEVKYGAAASSSAMSDLIVDLATINNNTPLTSVTEFTPSTTGVHFLGFHVYSDADQYYLYVDDISVIVTPTCDAPTGVQVLNPTTTGAEVNWTTPSTGSPVDYQVYVSATNTPPTAGTTPTMTGVNAPAMLTGLTANTTYYVWVRTNCGGTDLSAWTTAVSFATACNAANIPYTQDFESAAPPALPMCTSRENAGTGNNWYISSNPGYGFTDNALRYDYNSSNAANAWFYTQGLNLTAGTSYRLSFRYGSNSTGYNEKLEVKYGTAAANASMADLIIDLPAIKNNTPLTATVDFTPSATDVYYLGFHVYSAADQYYLYVDDITVTASPTCDVPTTFQFSNVTAMAADLSWTPSSLGTPVDYQVYVSTTNAAPTAGTTPTTTGANSPATLTALTANTEYFVWVRTNCGSGDLSAWASAGSVRTLCNEVTTFTENFDAVTTPEFPACWKKVSTTGGAYTQNTNSNSTPNTMYIYAGSASDKPVVSMPPVSNLGAGTHRLRFKARGNFTAGANIEVGYLTDPNDAASFNVIQSVTISSLTYQDYEVIPGAIPGVSVLAFRHAGNFAYSTLIDDVSWEALPSCNAPTGVVVSNVTTSGAEVNWVPPTVGTPVDYQVYVNTTTTAPTAGTTPTVTGATAPLTLNSLTVNTQYYVWVRSNCGSGDISEWSVMTGFKTLCDTASLPLTQGFNGTTAPSCWSTSIAAIQTASKISFVTSATNLTAAPQEGTHFVRYNSYSNTSGGAGSMERLVSPAMSTIGLSSVDVKFQWFEDGSSTYGSGAYLNEGVTVEWSTDGTTWTAAQYFPRHVDGAPTAGNWSAKSVYIPAAGNQNSLYIAFKFQSQYGYNMYMDAASVVASNTLPVTLTSFTGEVAGNINVLSWTTATEINNKGFEVERSSDGSNFRSIGFVDSKADANGNSNSQLNYSFNDERPFAGVSYYRLKQADRDGRTSYSKVISLQRKVTEVSFSSVYPNPALRDLNLMIASPSAQRVTVVVTDLRGRVMMQQPVQLIQGATTQQLNIQGLAAGTYIIKAVCANGCESAVHRFVKQ